MPKTFPEHSDEELYALLQNGRRRDAVFEELYDRLAPHIYRYCKRVLGNNTLTEDVFQETFIKFYKSISSEKKMTNVAAYVLTIARNLCLTAKSSKHYDLASLELVSLEDREIPLHAHAYENKELLGILKSAVECLPMDQKEAFILREYNGLSFQEIADMLGISVASAKMRTIRARENVRKILAPYISDLSAS